MQATFIQKVIICMVAGFLAACLLQWGKVFVTGADDALNAGYAHRAPLKFAKAIAAGRGPHNLRGQHEDRLCPDQFHGRRFTREFR